MVFRLFALDTPPERFEVPFLPSEHLSERARLHQEAGLVDAALYAAAQDEVLRLRVASGAFLRRRLGISYIQAQTLLHWLEEDGIIQRTTYGGRDFLRGWRYEVVAQ